MAKHSFSELQKTQAEILQSLADIKDIKAMDGLMTQLKKVKEEIGQYEKERNNSIADLNNLVTMYEVKLTELSVEAQKILGGGAEAAKTSKKSSGTAAPREKKAGDVLISIKTGPGRPAEYNKGQAIPQYVPRTFKALYEADKGQFETALKGHFTKEGEAYFGTPDGAVELKKLVDFVKTKKAQPTTKKK